MSLNRQASLSLSYIGFNNNKEPFNDVRVRQALSMAINKDEIISASTKARAFLPSARWRRT